MIERVFRTASSFAEAAELDRQDVALMTFEERISEVERLRRISTQLHLHRTRS